MEAFVKGDVLVLEFPFSDFTSVKRRPVVIIATPEGDDVICCQITSSRLDKYSVQIVDKDLKGGRLNMTSYARPNKLLTADKSLAHYKIGQLNERKTAEIIQKLKDIIEK